MPCCIQPSVESCCHSLRYAAAAEPLSYPVFPVVWGDHLSDFVTGSDVFVQVPVDVAAEPCQTGFAVGVEDVLIGSGFD